MLVLSRKTSEVLHIGPNITITVVRIGPNTVRLGIDAPREMKVLRGELNLHIDDEEAQSDEAQDA